MREELAMNIVFSSHQVEIYFQYCYRMTLTLDLVTTNSKWFIYSPTGSRLTRFSSSCAENVLTEGLLQDFSSPFYEFFLQIRGIRPLLELLRKKPCKVFFFTDCLFLNDYRHDIYYSTTCPGVNQLCRGDFSFLISCKSVQIE